MDTELAIRIAVLRVPPGVTFAIQRGKRELLSPSQSKDGSLIFDLSVRVSERKGGGSPNVLGPYAQTGGITWQLVQQALTPGAIVETQIDGTAGDGGPCCATVPLPGGWRVSQP